MRTTGFYKIKQNITYRQRRDKTDNSFEAPGPNLKTFLRRGKRWGISLSKRLKVLGRQTFAAKNKRLHHVENRTSNIINSHDKTEQCYSLSGQRCKKQGCYLGNSRL